MRRIAAIGLFVLASACGNDAATPEQPGDLEESPADPAVVRGTPGTSGTSGPRNGPHNGPGTRLTGQTSPLAGRISDFAVERTDFGTRVQLAADTLFEFDKAALTPAAETNLGRTAELIRQGGRGTVTVTGFTDSKGEDAYNLDLSRRRADAVVTWLRGQSGLEERTFVAKGLGEAEPVAPNAKPDGTDDPDGRARNRRVTIDIPR